jgi:diadenosine tetraphosphate (Ap4A) HIT family hydrolase
MLKKSCLFCNISGDADHKSIIVQNADGFVVKDNCPVSDGHALIIPKDHVASFFDVSDEVRLSLFSLLDKTKAIIKAEYQPDDFTIGINDGPASGQTIPHLHIHLIPRYLKDGIEPKGVRWVLPETADYLGLS